MEQAHPDPGKSYRFAFHARMSSSAQSASSLNRQLARIEALLRRLENPLVRVVLYARISSARSLIGGFNFLLERGREFADGVAGCDIAQPAVGEQVAET